MPTYASPISGGKTSPQGFLRILGRLFNASGVVDPAALTVAAQVSPDMTNKVSGSSTADNAIFIHTDGHFIHAWNSSSVNVTISANASGSSKTDAIVAYVDLAAGDGTNANNPGALKFKAVRGTSGAPNSGQIAADPNVGANPYIVLAHVTVANGAASINSGNITDQRPFARIDGSRTAARTLTLDRLAYEAWSTWTPTISPQASMTGSALSITHAKYTRVGNTVHFNILASLTTGGTATNWINISMPVNRASTGAYEIAGGASVVDGAYLGAGFCLWSDTSQTTIRLYKADFSNFGLGASRIMRIWGTYEAITP